MRRRRNRLMCANPASAVALAVFACCAFAQDDVLLAQAPKAAPAAAAPASEPAVGTVTHLSGILTVKRPDGSTRLLSVKSGISEGDTLNTEQGTYARVKFQDGAEVVLRPESRVKVDNYKFDAGKPERDNMFLSMIKGGFRSVTGLIGRRNREKVMVAAPNATIGIRGTHFGALFCQGDCGRIPTASGQLPPNGLHLDVTNGAIVVRNQGGEQVINAGQFGYVRDVQTPPAIVPPNQGIQVTMPPAIARNVGAGRTLGATRNDNECAVQ